MVNQNQICFRQRVTIASSSDVVSTWEEMGRELLQLEVYSKPSLSSGKIWGDVLCQGSIFSFSVLKFIMVWG